MCLDLKIQLNSYLNLFFFEVFFPYFFFPDFLADVTFFFFGEEITISINKGKYPKFSTLFPYRKRTF